MKKIKSFIKKYGMFHIQNETLFSLNRTYKTYKKLHKRYGYVLNKDYQLNEQKEPSNIVWFCWLQGIDNAPELVKSCYEYLKKNLINKKIVLISLDNYQEYAKIPQFIIDKWEKGIIGNAHFSDILRLELLIKNGGTWIDSTVLCTQDIPTEIDNADFFVFSNEYRGDEGISVSNWFIHANKNHPILLYTRDMIYKYWTDNNKVVNYYFFHMFMTMAMRKYNNLIADMPFVSNINPHVLLFKYLFEPYSEKTADFIKQTCFAHKLSYKFGEQVKLEGTNYKAIVERKF